MPMNTGKKPGCNRILRPLANRFMRKPWMKGITKRAIQVTE